MKLRIPLQCSKEIASTSDPNRARQKKIREQYFKALKKRVVTHDEKESGRAYKEDNDRFLKLYRGIDKRMEGTELGERPKKDMEEVKNILPKSKKSKTVG